MITKKALALIAAVFALAAVAYAGGGRRHSSAPPPWIQFEGTIKSVGAGSFVLTAEHVGDVTITVDDKTSITQGHTALKLSDLKQGEQVHVQAVKNGTDTVAVRVMVQDDNENEPPDEHGTTMTAEGTVTATASGQITVHTEDHGDVVVQIDSSTIIRRQGQTLTPTDIKVGDEVNARGTKVDDHTLKATQIEVRGIDQNQEVHGTVTKVGTSSITVAGVTINADSSTVIKKRGQTIQLSDIKVGDRVEAEGTRVDENTLLARQITVEGDDD
jgi:Cu/Ag efflux protein CusF